MTKKKRPPSKDPASDRVRVPPGATREAFDRDRAEGHGGPPHTPLVSRHATGDTGDEEAVTGLVGPEDGDKRDVDGQDPLENGPPYSGHAGGSVGGTPAESRATGGAITGGLVPESGERPMDTTVGAPAPRTRRRPKK